MHANWKGKRVLITGVCGTIGSELLRQVVAQDPEEIIGLDNNETELFFLEQRFPQKNVNLYFGDITQLPTLTAKMAGIDIVLHTAAMKHVIISERSPRHAVLTNILGTQNVIDAAVAANVERVLFTSSDKAVNPTSVMGTSKLMGERLMTAASSLSRARRPIFASTRFGNVLGSRGSVIPIFEKQIASAGPVTLTDERMTRFIMSVQEAVRLVMDSVFLARGGEVFVTKMPVVRIAELAQVMVEELAPTHGFDPADIEMRCIGTKPGEKLYEELMNEEETRRTSELPRYFVVRPAFTPVYEEPEYDYPGIISSTIVEPYNSANEESMVVREIRAFLYAHGLIQTPVVEETAPKPSSRTRSAVLAGTNGNGKEIH